MKGFKRKQIEEYTKDQRWTPENYYWEHALLVRKLALMIQKKVGGDRDIVEVVSLLHDVGKTKLLAPGHEGISAQMAQEFLKKIGFDKNKIPQIAECISYKNFRSNETRILRSADSMALLMDTSGGREWYFNNILGNKKERILEEIEKSYSEIEFDFARNKAAESYKKLLSVYS